MEQATFSRKVRQFVTSFWKRFLVSNNDSEEDSAFENREPKLKKHYSESHLEKIEDLVSDGLCVAGVLDLCVEAQETWLSSYRNFIYSKRKMFQV